MNGVRSGSANAVHPGAGLPPHPQNSERAIMKGMGMAEQHERPPPSKRKSANSNRSKSAQRKGSGHIKHDVLPSETGGLGT